MTVGTGGGTRTGGILPPMPHPRADAATPALALWLLAGWTVGSALWFVSSAFPMAPLVALQQASGGWLSVTLVASMGIGLVQLAILAGPGRRTPASFGWRWRDLPAGLAAGVLLWGLMHGPMLGGWVAGAGPLEMHPAWATGLGIALGPLLAQLLGTALVEETVFRGFLWPEFVRRLGGGRRGAWIGAIASQAVFALLHLPIRLSQGASGGELVATVLGLMLVGLVFVVVYAATGNLFVAVAVHALGNAPTLLLAPQGAPTMWLLGGTLALVAAAAPRRRDRDTGVPPSSLVASRAHP